LTVPPLVIKHNFVGAIHESPFKIIIYHLSIINCWTRLRRECQKDYCRERAWPFRH